MALRRASLECPSAHILVAACYPEVKAQTTGLRVRQMARGYRQQLRAAPGEASFDSVKAARTADAAAVTRANCATESQSYRERMPSSSDPRSWCWSPLPRILPYSRVNSCDMMQSRTESVLYRRLSMLKELICGARSRNTLMQSWTPSSSPACSRFASSESKLSRPGLMPCEASRR